MPEKPKVGLLGLMLELYDGPYPELKDTMGRFAQDIAAALSDRLRFAFPGVCMRADEVESAVARFEAEGCDMVMVVCLTYSPSLVSVPALLRTQLPVVIFDTARAASLGPEMGGQDIMENHGIHGVQDLANVLTRRGRSFQLVVGHYQDARALDELVAWACAAQAMAGLRRLKVGLLGEPFEGMGDFSIDPKALRDDLGPEIVPLSMTDLSTCAQGLSDDEVGREAEDARRCFEVDASLTDDLLATSARWGLALRRLIESKGLGAFSMNFLAFRPEEGAETVPFLGASQLLADGVGYAGEGDVCCAALVAASANLCGPASFTEMFCPDFASGEVIMSHMGECNLAMARDDRPVKLVAKPFAWAPIQEPAVPIVCLAPGPATLASLTAWCDPPASGWRLVVTEGTIVDTPPYPNLQSPYSKFEPSGSKTSPTGGSPVDRLTALSNVEGLEGFLRDYSLAGGTHHLVIVFGHRTQDFRKLADLLRIQCVVV